MKPSLQKFSTLDQLVKQLGTAITQQLEAAIRDKGHASMAVSGGNSPKPLFEYLAQQPLRWSAVTITLVDERWVDEDDLSSNAKLVKTCLLQHHASGAQFIPLYNGDDNAFAAQENVDALLAEITLPFDVVILGMGEDGHTASFFPGAEQLAHALFPSSNPRSSQRCCAIDPPTAPHQRMTLTLPMLLQSQKMYLLVTGKKKHEVLEQALQPIAQTNNAISQDDLVVPAAIAELPVRSVLHQDSCDIDIYYCD